MDRDELILSKMPLVKKAVSHYVRKHPSTSHLKDDLQSAATLELVRMVERASKLENADAYVWTCMLGAMSDCVERENTIYVPSSSRTRALKTGKPIAPIYTDKMPTELVDPRSTEITLNDVLDCCRNDREKRIIELRAAGFTQKEIAARISTSQAYVSKIIDEIEERFDSDETGSDAPFAIPIRPAGTSTTCACGERVRYSNENRCEDCWSNDQQKYHGRSQRIKTAA